MDSVQQVPAQKTFPWVPVVGGCCVLMLIAGIAVLVVGGKMAKEYVDNAVRDPELSATLFFTTLKGDVDTAYALTAPEFQEASTKEELAAYVGESPMLTEWTSINFPSVDVEEGLAMLEGTLETDTEYTTLYVEALQADDGAWRVNYFEIGYDPGSDEEVTE